MTEQQPIFRSPIIAPDIVGADAELTLIDLTGAPVLIIQGEAGAALAGQFGAVPQRPGEVLEAGAALLLARLTPAEFYLCGTSGHADLPSAGALERSLTSAYATDLTHGQAVLKLKGHAAPELLSQVCGLDFREAAFPSGRVQQTSAAKIKALIIRRDEDSLPCYYLHVSRPLGQYFWDTLIDAGQTCNLNQ